jgi:alkanesulfonate monooxygenase SsuD/methylene tetrahydromethanopterin reductase-like flavin-dependent oxidoreductase (luciferase family)
VLAVGLGGRDDDYEASGLPTTGRGARLEELLEELKRIWSGEERGYAGAIGPTPTREGGPELIVGGHDEAALRRTARFGDGWIMGGGTPEMFAQLGGAVDQAWRAAGRSGKPRKLSLAYFALGPRVREQADSYMSITTVGLASSPTRSLPGKAEAAQRASDLRPLGHPDRTGRAEERVGPGAGTSRARQDSPCPSEPHWQADLVVVSDRTVVCPATKTAHELLDQCPW